MSTITDALEKRKKEAGENQVHELVPVSLDEPNIEVPEEKKAKRIVALVAVLLLVVGGVASAVILGKDLLGGKRSGDQGGGAAQVASLPQGEGPEISSAPETEEPLPLPGTSPTEEPSLAGTPPEAPETVPSPEPSPAEGPPLPKTEPPTPETISPTAPSGPTPEGATPAPKPDSVAPEPVVAAPPDPFAGIKLQGIIRFDPTTPEVLINGKTLKVGESLNGIKVVEIGEDSVKLRCGAIEKTLRY